MNADEAWEEYVRSNSSIAKRDASLQGQLNTMQAQLNELSNATQMITQLATKLMGDDAQMQATGGQSPTGAPPIPEGTPNAPPAQGAAPGGAPPEAAAGGVPPEMADQLRAAMTGSAPPAGGMSPEAPLPGPASPAPPEEEIPVSAPAPGPASPVGSLRELDDLTAEDELEEEEDEGMPVPVQPETSMLEDAYAQFVSALTDLAHQAVDRGRMNLVDSVQQLINTLEVMWDGKIVPLVNEIDGNTEAYGIGSSGSGAEAATGAPSATDTRVDTPSADRGPEQEVAKSVKKVLRPKTSIAKTASKKVLRKSAIAKKVGGEGAMTMEQGAQSMGAVDGAVTQGTDAGTQQTGEGDGATVTGTGGAGGLDSGALSSEPVAASMGSFRELMRARSLKKSESMYDHILKGGDEDVDAANGQVGGWDAKLFNEDDPTTYYSSVIPVEYQFTSKVHPQTDQFSKETYTKFRSMLNTRPENFESLVSILVDPTKRAFQIRNSMASNKDLSTIIPNQEMRDFLLNLGSDVVGAGLADFMDPADGSPPWNIYHILGHTLETAERAHRSANSRF